MCCISPYRTKNEPSLYFLTRSSQAWDNCYRSQLNYSKSAIWADTDIRLIPANTTHWSNVGLMLGQRRRRWANIKPTLFQSVVFAGIVHKSLRRVRETDLQLDNFSKRKLFFTKIRHDKLAFSLCPSLTQTHGLASEMDSIAKAVVLYAGRQCNAEIGKLWKMWG